MSLTNEFCNWKNLEVMGRLRCHSVASRGEIEGDFYVCYFFISQELVGKWNIYVNTGSIIPFYDSLSFLLLKILLLFCVHILIGCQTSESLSILCIAHDLQEFVTCVQNIDASILSLQYVTPIIDPSLTNFFRYNIVSHYWFDGAEQWRR